MLYKKCTACKKEFSHEDFENQFQLVEKKKQTLTEFKKKCPDCGSKLKTYDESRFQKKWYGYLNKDKKIIEHLVLAEFMYYDDDSVEVKVPLLNSVFEYTDSSSSAILSPANDISSYLKNLYNQEYDSEHKFLTQAFIKETNPEQQNVPAWW